MFRCTRNIYKEREQNDSLIKNVILISIIFLKSTQNCIKACVEGALADRMLTWQYNIWYFIVGSWAVDDVIHTHYPCLGHIHIILYIVLLLPSLVVVWAGTQAWLTVSLRVHLGCNGWTCVNTTYWCCILCVVTDGTGLMLKNNSYTHVQWTLNN